MEDLIKFHKMYNSLTIGTFIFTPSFLYSMFKYQTATDYIELKFFITSLLFILALVSIVGTVFVYLRLFPLMEEDIIKKVKKMNINIVKQQGFNRFKINNEDWTIDFSRTPAQEVFLNQNEKKIQYK